MQMLPFSSITYISCCSSAHNSDVKSMDDAPMVFDYKDPIYNNYYCTSVQMCDNYYHGQRSKLSCVSLSQGIIGETIDNEVNLQNVLYDQNEGMGVLK